MSEPTMLPRIRSALFEVATQEAAPGRRRTLWVITALFAALLIWAILARIDIVSVAPGRLVPETYVKIVQPTEAGIIRELLVKDGDQVQQGQVLIRLDPTENTADSSANDQQLALERLQIRRVEAQLGGRPLRREPGDEPVLFNRVEAQMRAHQQATDDALAEAMAARGRAASELDAEIEELSKLERTAPSLRSAADSYAQLAKQNLVGRLEAEERQRLATEREQDLQAQRATVISLRAALVQAERNAARVLSNSRSELQALLVESAARASQLEQTDAKLAFRGRNLELRAPQAGVVKDLATTTVGAVVQPGTVLLNLVPVGETLRAELSIENADIGFVRTGQKVRIKLATYPFQRYGTLEGELISVSPDAQPAESLQAVDAEGGAALPGYKGIVRLSSQSLRGSMGEMTINAGMQLTAEIIEGDRTVMEYLLSPVRKLGDEAGRER